MPMLDDGSTWKVIDFLMGLHPGKKLLLKMAIDPTKIKVEVIDGISN